MNNESPSVYVDKEKKILSGIVSIEAGISDIIYGLKIYLYYNKYH